MKSYFLKYGLEAGCDEAGRGCLAGPVYAAAVILPKNFKHKVLTDSKKLTVDQRNELRKLIEKKALAYAVASVGQDEIDKINILSASIKAMTLAVKKLDIKPDRLLIDGNRFYPYEPNLEYHTIIKGDEIYFSIAAASILAKTYRDEYMEKLHDQFPIYNWIKNKGYATLDHRNAIKEHGICDHHRKTFQLYDDYEKPNLFSHSQIED